MGKQLVKGEKAVICAINENLNQLTLELKYEIAPGLTPDFDFFLFQQGETNRVDKRDIIFYHSPQSRCTGIRYTEDYRDAFCWKTFDINLGTLPENTAKLILGCSLYKKKGDCQQNKTVNLFFKVVNRLLQEELMSYTAEVTPDSIESVIIGNIYKHNGSWKFHAVDNSSGNNLLNSVSTFFDLVFS